MKHYTLLKLAPGADIAEARHHIHKAYEKLDAELDWANHPVIFPGCGGDMDLMAIMELDDPEHLETFHAHPASRKLREKLADSVTATITFDHY